MRFVTIGGIVVFAVLAAILLAHAVGQRGTNGQITGDSQSNGGTPTTASEAVTLAAAKAAALAQPKSYDAQISYARALMSTGDLPTAIEEFVDASRLDAKQPEPLTYAGWLTVLVAQQVTDKATQKTLLDSAASHLDQAISVDPTYPDAYVFKGLLLSQMEKRPCDGALAFQQFLVRRAERQLDAPHRADRARAGGQGGEVQSDDQYTNHQAVRSQSWPPRCRNRRPTRPRSTASRSRPTAVRS